MAFAILDFTKDRLWEDDHGRVRVYPTRDVATDFLAETGDMVCWASVVEIPQLVGEVSFVAGGCMVTEEPVVGTVRHSYFIAFEG